MLQPRFPSPNPNTLGGGYVAGDIPLPQAAPMQQAAAQRPSTSAQGAPWSFGAIGDIQHTTGGNELSTQLYREAGELEAFAQRMHADGVDVTRPDARDPVAMEAHKWFQDKLWRLRNLQAELHQARGHETAYLKGVSEGKLLPSSRLNAAMPFTAQQAAQAYAQQNEVPEVQDYQKRHTGYMNALAAGHFNPTMRDMAIQDYNKAVAAVQARAQQYGHDQNWVQTQVNRIPEPPTESATKRKVDTTEQTQSGYHEVLNPEFTARARSKYGSGAGMDAATGDAFKAASLAMGRVSPTGVDLTQGTPAFTDNLGRNRKLGTGAGAPTILSTRHDAATGRTGWLAQDPPTTHKGKKVPGAVRFHEWQRDPITQQYDILAELKKTMVPTQYKDMLKALVANGYVHVDRNGNPTEIADLDRLLQAMGEDGQPQDNAPQEQPQQNDTAAPFSF